MSQREVALCRVWVLGIKITKLKDFQEQNLDTCIRL
jgi:hypothetical protein